LLKTTLEDGPKFVAALSFCLLALTVFHDWGYFWIIGSKFQTLQTPYDFVANSIAWLPESLAIIGLYAVISNIVFARLVRRRVSTPNAGSLAERRREIRKSFRALVVMRWTSLIGAISVAALAYVLRFPGGVLFGCGAFALLYIFFAMPVLLSRRFKEISGEWRFVLFSMPFVVYLAFISGTAEAIVAISNFANVYSIAKKDGSKLQILLLRNLDKGALVYDLAAQQALFIRWDDLTTIGHPVIFPRRHQNTLLCTISPYGCESPEP
jgi:hypothetical protein